MLSGGRDGFYLFRLRLLTQSVPLTLLGRANEVIECVAA
jgi:hypothetical protein